MATLTDGSSEGESVRAEGMRAVRGAVAVKAGVGDGGDEGDELQPASRPNDRVVNAAAKIRRRIGPRWQPSCVRVTSAASSSLHSYPSQNASDHREGQNGQDDRRILSDQKPRRHQAGCK